MNNIKFSFGGQLIGEAESIQADIKHKSYADFSKPVKGTLGFDPNTPLKRVEIQHTSGILECKDVGITPGNWYGMVYPSFDLQTIKTPPRNGHYRTKRLRKKWVKLHGEVTNFKNCTITKAE